jgi:catechol 2,3-dioxygenase-like lactoylglutathione lyase family enzyme
MSTNSIDMKLKVVVIPVSNFDRAAEFYKKLGWMAGRHAARPGVFQFTPPGSACSVQFGANRTPGCPGPPRASWLIVSDI